jgi:hypothetical protein
VPIGWDGWAYLNEPKAKPEGQTTREPGDDDSAIPF